LPEHLEDGDMTTQHGMYRPGTGGGRGAARFATAAMLALLGLALLLAGCGGTASSERSIFITAWHDANGDGQFLGEEQLPGIFAVAPEGDGVTRISEPGFWHIGASVSPTGGRMSYSAWRQDTNGDGVADPYDEQAIYVADLDGSNEVEIMRSGTIAAGLWSRDGTRLAVQYGEQGDWLIVNADGSGERNLTQDEFQATEYSAFDWLISPDGTLRIEIGTGPTWFVVDAERPPGDLGGAVPLSDEVSNYMLIGWAPDSERILLVVREGGGQEALPWEVPITLYAINADGSGLTQLSSDGGGSELAQWSPDGKQTAYLSWWEDADGDGVAEQQRDRQSPALYVVNADGSEGRRLLGDDYRIGIALGW
jgi:dipeptidyl aminopeptidase/acylaminoacyl peptidase